MEAYSTECHSSNRQDLPRSGKLSVLNLLKSPIISIFALQGRHVAPIQVKFGTAGRHVDPLGRAKFHPNRCIGVGTGPQKWKISTFGEVSRIL